MAKQVMLKFIERNREMPQKRAADDRALDYQEIYAEYSDEKAEEQAARCSQCGVPYCLSHCPLQNNIPDWLRLTAENRLEEAYQTSQYTNNFPEITGRICPQDRLCEGNCVIENSGHGTVTIGSVEKYLTDKAWENGWVQPRISTRKRNQKIAIIGSGPAGLAAADELSAQGFEVSVYERNDRAGGLLTYGIPGFKLEKQIVMRRIELLEAQGVNFIYNTEIGRDVSFASLQENYDAILLATGVYKMRALEREEGAQKAGIVQALDFLTASNKANFGDQVAEHEDGSLFAKDKNIIVIGGGDTAMDCVRTSIRQGAKSVKCFYRRDRDNMPGSARETQNAEEEGVIFEWLTAPKRFLGDGRLTHVEAVKMSLGNKDASGRRVPVEIENSHFQESADLVITALGFEPEDLNAKFLTEFETTKWQTIKADNQNFATNIPGVFAAGDIVRGASLVVWAIKEGRDAAQGISKYLRTKATQTTAAE